MERAARWTASPTTAFATVLGFAKPAPGLSVRVPAGDSETTIYHLLAARYALADENFATRLIPTFPSHYALATAQSRIAGNPNSIDLGLRREAGHDGSDLRRRRGR